MPASYTSGQPSNPRRHPTCWASSQRNYTFPNTPCHEAWTSAPLSAHPLKNLWLKICDWFLASFTCGVKLLEFNRNAKEFTADVVHLPSSSADRAPASGSFFVNRSWRTCLFWTLALLSYLRYFIPYIIVWASCWNPLLGRTVSR